MPVFNGGDSDTLTVMPEKIKEYDSQFFSDRDNRAPVNSSLVRIIV